MNGRRHASASEGKTLDFQSSALPGSAKTDALRVAIGVVQIAMRRTISREVWEQIKTAYAAGIGLREIARNMGISEGDRTRSRKT